MKYTPGFIWGYLDKDNYKKRGKGDGYTFRERKRMRVSCDACGGIMTVSSLMYHT